MESLALNRRRYRCQVFTEDFKIEGQLEPMGEVVTALSDKRRGFMTVHNTTMTPISAHNPLSSIAIPELILNKQNITLVALLDPKDYADIRLSPNTKIVTVYTSTYAIQAEFHLGEEMRMRDFIDSMVSDFMPITQVRLFPLCPTKTILAENMPFAALNRKFVTMYHNDSD